MCHQVLQDNLSQRNITDTNVSDTLNGYRQRRAAPIVWILLSTCDTFSAACSVTILCLIQGEHLHTRCVQTESECSYICPPTSLTSGANLNGSAVKKQNNKKRWVLSVRAHANFSHFDAELLLLSCRQMNICQHLSGSNVVLSFGSELSWQSWKAEQHKTTTVPSSVHPAEISNIYHLDRRAHWRLIVLTNTARDADGDVKA